MGKLFAILLSLLVLIQSFNLSFNDIVQLDELIEHAQYHKIKYGDNLFEFISKHYGDLKHEHHKNHEDEDNDHQELPFQNCDHFITISLFVIQQQISEAMSIYELDNIEVNFNYIPSHSTLHKRGILQPPKSA